MRQRRVAVHSLVAFFSIAFQPFEFAQFPCIVGRFGILVVRIEITLNTVVGFLLLDLLVSNGFFDDLSIHESEEVQTIVANLTFCDCTRR